MIHASCRTADDLALDSRRLISAAAEAVARAGDSPGPGPFRIADWPERCPDIAVSVERFFPTAILLRDLQWSDSPHILMDLSVEEYPGFLSAIYMAESVENLEWGRLKVIAGRAFFQPPAVRHEDQTRFELMAALGKGVPLREELGFRPRMLLRRLQGIDPAALDELGPAEQLALVTVAASRNGPAAFLSASGTWPRSLPVEVAAANNRCRIHRFTLEGIPEPSLHRIRYARYEAPPTAV